MSESDDATDKRVIGLYGEMRFAMELHERGWQVYRAYIDEKFDFVIMRTYCDFCSAFTAAHIRATPRPGRKPYKAVTNLCEKCENDSLRMLVRLIQVKTSEGKDQGKEGVRDYSFHPKIRYHLADGRVFYAWVQVWDRDNVNFYIFHTDEISRFDDIALKSYQISDNQQIHLDIDKDGEIDKPIQTIKNFGVFSDALNDFAVLEQLRPDEVGWHPRATYD